MLFKAPIILSSNSFLTHLLFSELFQYSPVILSIILNFQFKIYKVFLFIIIYI